MLFLLFLFILTLLNKVGSGDFRACILVAAFTELMGELAIYAVWLNGSSG